MNDTNNTGASSPEEYLLDPLREIQNAQLWGLASLQSVLGSARGEEVFSSLNPSMVVSFWLWVLGEALDADES
jgi:hypothetical protein